MFMDFQDYVLDQMVKLFRKAKFSHKFQYYLNLQLAPARAVQEDLPSQKEDKWGKINRNELGGRCRRGDSLGDHQLQRTEIHISKVEYSKYVL